MKTLASERQIGLKYILFATDFEVSASRAFPFALAIAKRYSARLDALHVIPTKALALASPQSIHRVLAQAEDFARYGLNQLLGPFRHHGLSCRALIGEGNVTDVIEEFVKQSATDLLVVGTSSRMGLSKVFLGSVAEELIRDSPCPVLAVGPNVTTLASDGIHSIVCPIDFSDASAKATQFAIALASEYQAHLTFVHVLPHIPKGPLQMAAELIERRVFDAMPEEPEFPYPPEVIVETGPVADCILNLTTDLYADLVVMGAHGTGSFAEMASHFGSIAHRVVSLATCPVLTVGDVQVSQTAVENGGALWMRQ